MSEPITPKWLLNLGVFLQEESEGQHLWGAVFVVILLVGAVMIEASMVQPGASATSLLEDGETLEQASAGSNGEVLLLLDRTDSSSLRIFDSQGISEVDSGSFEPLSIDSTSSGWLIGGSDGALATYDGSSFNSIEMSWLDQNPGDVISVASNDGSSGFLICEWDGRAKVHSFTNGNVSDGVTTSVSTTLLTDVHLSPSGNLAIVTGFDTALGNPAFGRSGEIVYRVQTTMGDTPQMNLIHHGAGGAIHSVSFLPEGSWGVGATAMLASSTSTLFLLKDSTIVEMNEIAGSTSAVAEESGTILMLQGDSGVVLTMEPGAEKPSSHKLSESSIVDATHSVALGSEVLFFGEGIEGTVGVLEIDTTADADITKSFARFGDLIFLLLVLAALVVIAQNFWVNQFQPW